MDCIPDYVDLFLVLPSMPNWDHRFEWLVIEGVGVNAQLFKTIHNQLE